MAYYTDAPDAGDDLYVDQVDQGQDDYSTAVRPRPLAKLANLSGALVSLALIAGIGVWGYKLIVRDVSGIPVVRAAKGEMRVRPDEPGGDYAQHQGLSVNTVAALGTAGAPADKLKLAPKPVDLTAEDHITPVAMRVEPAPGAAMEAGELSDEAVADVSAPDVAAALQSGEVDALVEQLVAGVAPLEPAPGVAAPLEQSEALAGEPEAVEEIPEPILASASPVIDAPGVSQSLRPRKRPADAAMIVPASMVSEVPTPAPSPELDADNLPKGTRLAQLGAFDSPEVAREQWEQLQGRFSAYLGGKQRVIQKATSGGRVFYRLRAHGFEDIADARRFCSALVAENADCIPVVTR
jgi:hypothetical protein